MFELKGSATYPSIFLVEKYKKYLQKYLNFIQIKIKQYRDQFETLATKSGVAD